MQELPGALEPDGDDSHKDPGPKGTCGDECEHA